jgi:hypothetical protein
MVNFWQISRAVKSYERLNAIASASRSFFKSFAYARGNLLRCMHIGNFAGFCLVE